MEHRRLGDSGLEVSALSLGGWLNAGGWVDEKRSIYLMHHAFAAGINLFDEADMYTDGQAEIVLGKALKDLPRDQIVVATKCGLRVQEGPFGAGLSKKHIIQSCEKSLQRLGLEYIDLYQAHVPDRETPIEETMEAFDLLIRQGKVLYIGCSNFSDLDIIKANNVAWENGWRRFISNQPKYNMLHRDPEAAIFPATLKEGMGNIIFSPLAHGILSGKYNDDNVPDQSRIKRWDLPSPFYNEANLEIVGKLRNLASEADMTVAQLAIRWCLLREEVSSVILGASNPDQLDENLGALDKTISQDLQAVIAALLVSK